MPENSKDYSPRTCGTQEIMNASPGKITLMLYDGAIDFLNEAMAAVSEKNETEARNAVLRVCNILREFMATLDMQYDLSKQLMSLYDYMEHRLESANLKESISELKEVRMLLTELRDAWAEATLKQ